MIGITDRKETVKKFKKLLDEYGDDLISEITVDTVHDFNDSTINFEVRLTLKIPDVPMYTKKLAKILGWKK